MVVMAPLLIMDDKIANAFLQTRDGKLINLATEIRDEAAESLAKYEGRIC